ncbi:MAG: hypothetical protein ACYDHP_11545, partial [Ferrimicrobium sp.]
ASGIVITLAILMLHAHQGTSIVNSYGYLAQSHSLKPSTLAIGVGAITHPGLAISTLLARRGPIGQLYVYSGILGIFFPPSGFASVVGVLFNGLQSSPSFIAIRSGGFQNFPEVSLLLMGTAISLTWLFGRSGDSMKAAVRSGFAATIFGLFAVVLSITLIPVDRAIPPSWLAVTPAGANLLNQALKHTPASEEVVASQGVIGPFGSRANIYPFELPANNFPVCASTMEIIVAINQGAEIIPASEQYQAVHALEHRAHTVLTSHGHSIWIFQLSDLSKGYTLTLPSGAVAPSPTRNPLKCQ